MTTPARRAQPTPVPPASALAEIISRPAVKLLAKVRDAHPDEFLASVAEMLGDTAWAGFRERARTVFADRFPDPLHDRHDVLLAIGIKE